MSLLRIPLHEIRATHLRRLVEDGEGESKTIEYKRELPSGARADKVEFLKGVTSFANTIGGDLIYGIEAKDGVPVRLVGLPGVNVDADQLRLINLLQNSVDPRLFGVELHPVRLDNAGTCLIVRAPRSLNGPHMVRYEEHWRFWGRNAGGKYPLDADELRRAFNMSGDLRSRVRAFRTERLAMIRANEGPVSLIAPSAIVMHFVPLAALDGAASIDPREVRQLGIATGPLNSAGGVYQRYSLDGNLEWDPGSDSAIAQAYALVFRTGVIEAVISGIAKPDGREEDAPLLVPIAAYEPDILKWVSRYMSILDRLSVPPPVFVMLTLIGVHGAYIEEYSSSYRRRLYTFDRDIVPVSDVMFESFTDPINTTMKPVIDAIWNAGGHPGSPNFDSAGGYKGTRQARW